jgi:amino acid permease
LIVVLVLFLLISITLFAVALLAKKDVTLPAAIEGTIAVICFAVCYIQYANINRRVQENDAKLQRAISLLNKVKAKYVNNTNTLDYIYSEGKSKLVPVRLQGKVTAGICTTRCSAMQRNIHRQARAIILRVTGW